MATKAVKTPKVAKPVIYVWEGLDRKGAKVTGELTGHNPALIKAQLRKQGVNPLKVRKKSVSIFGAGKKIKPLDIAFFLASDGNHDESRGATAAVFRHHQRRLR